METAPHRSVDRRPDRIGFPALIRTGSAASLRRTGRWLIGAVISSVACADAVRADIPWPEVQARVARENELLARRPQGHAGEYFVVCTLYYTPMESGFTADRGFDVTPVTRPGLGGRKYPIDFLAAVKKEGFGRVREPVNGCHYVRYDGGKSYRFAKHVAGRGSNELVARFSAATRSGQRGLSHGVAIETLDETVKKVFGSTQWKIVDTGGGLRRWQIDLYWGEDEPLGAGRLMARPKGTEFEYAYSVVKIREGVRGDGTEANAEHRTSNAEH